MNGDVENYLEKYPDEIKKLFHGLRETVLKSTSQEVGERLWAKLPSYYSGEKFVRLIPFKDHINVEAAAVASHRDELSGYKITPKGMLQIFVGKEVPADVLIRIFKETLT